jgi:hypothetical protein
MYLQFFIVASDANNEKGYRVSRLTQPKLNWRRESAVMLNFHLRRLRRPSASDNISIISKNCLCDLGTLTLLVIDFKITPVKFVCLQTPISMNFYNFNSMAFLNRLCAGCSADWVWREYLCVDSSWKMVGEQQRQDWSSWQITLDSTVPNGTTAVVDLHPPESAPSGSIVSSEMGGR